MLHLSTSFREMLCFFYRQRECKVSSCILLGEDQGYVTSSEINYLTCRGSMISYLPDGKEHIVNDNGRWSRQNRQEGKPSRIVRKLLTEKAFEVYDIKDADIEQFGYYLQSYVLANGDGDDDKPMPKISMWVANGEFIKQYYDGDWYAKGQDSNLSGSCMRSKDESYFDLYADNHNVCHILVARDDQFTLHGRALLWKTHVGWCMDTVYAAEHIRPMFIDFAIQHGMRYKSSQSCHHQLFDMFDGKIDGSTYFEVKMQYTDGYEYYPYMDTLSYMCDISRTISNNDNDMMFELRSTDGERSDLYNDDVECIWTGEYYSEDQTYYVDYSYEGRWYQGNVHEDHVVIDKHGSRFIEDHCVRVGSYWYLKDDDDIRYCENDDAYYMADDCVWSETAQSYLHYDDAAEDCHGEWHLKDDVVTTHDGRVVHERDAVEDEDGNYYVIGDYSVIGYNEQVTN